MSVEFATGRGEEDGTNSIACQYFFFDFDIEASF
jgi:hypothetical protein